MNDDQTRKLRAFLEELTNFPFLLKGVDVYDKNSALEFVNSYQEEEQIYEHFLTGLVNQSEFYPINVNEWLKFAKICNYNHPAILDENIDLTEGGPVNDWYIYARFIKWLIKNSPNNVHLQLDEQDKQFLKYDVPF